jgi:hypothetical protein
VLDIKHRAEEGIATFRRTFHKFAFEFKGRIHKVGNGKQIVLVASGVINNFY